MLRICQFHNLGSTASVMDLQLCTMASGAWAIHGIISFYIRGIIYCRFEVTLLSVRVGKSLRYKFTSL